MADPFPPHPEVLGRSILVRGAKFDFEEVSLRSAGGMEYRRQHVRHPGAVCILPVRVVGDRHSVVFVRNYRAAPGAYMLELPAGTLEPGEPPEACAARELIEETGYRAATLAPLGRFHTSPGISDEVIWAFVARGLVQVGQALEDGEQLVVEEVDLADTRRRIREGEMTDAKSMLSILLADARGLLETAAP
jgi:ADP-ribose pyrophosphatase